MKSKNNYIFIIVIMFLSLGITALYVSKTISNTGERDAYLSGETLQKVMVVEQISNLQTGCHLSDGNGNTFFVPSKLVTETFIAKVKEGITVTVYVAQTPTDKEQEAGVAMVRSLKVGSDEIYSYDVYCDFINATYRFPITTGIVLAVGGGIVFLGGIFFLIVCRRKNNLKNVK